MKLQPSNVDYKWIFNTFRNIKNDSGNRCISYLGSCPILGALIERFGRSTLGLSLPNSSFVQLGASPSTAIKIKYKSILIFFYEGDHKIVIRVDDHKKRYYKDHMLLKSF